MKQIEVVKFKIVPDSPENILLDPKDNSIKGAVLDKLIERVTYHKDMGMLRCF